MAEFLNLYKIKNLNTEVLSDFIDEEGLKDFIRYKQSLGESLDGYKIYCLNMENITPYLDIDELLKEE